MQRLFTSFADGWPGKGLLTQRALVAAILVYGLLTNFEKTTHFPAVLTMALVELWIAVSQISDPLLSVILAILGGTLAMIGPGAWSIDALLFGRKHIDISNR
jgi:hypothetical protein